MFADNFGITKFEQNYVELYFKASHIAASHIKPLQQKAPDLDTHKHTYVTRGYSKLVKGVLNPPLQGSVLECPVCP